MMQSPVKKIYITQEFGVNPSSYARYGLNGHNGIDFRAFLLDGSRCYESGKSPVYAPHGGMVTENAYDPEGYGNYIKIENEKQGSVLAHFDSRSNKVVGSTVHMGDLIGYQGSTGNSTGLHLHWGWYPIPRDWANGYNGYENQNNKYTPFQEGSNMTDYRGYDLDNKDSMKVAVDSHIRIVNREMISADEANKTLMDQAVKMNAERDKAADEAYSRGKADGLAAGSGSGLPIDIDPEVWQQNGLQVETTNGSQKTTVNYARKV